MSVTRRHFILNGIGFMSLGLAVPPLLFEALQGTSCFAADAAVPTDGLSFYLPFDNNLESTLGTQRAPVSMKGTPVFVPGKIGEALRTGTKDTFLIYDADGNMRGNEGTLSLWIRPQWDAASNNYHVFWQMRGEGRFILYRSGDAKKLHFLYQGKGLSDQQYNVLTVSIDGWKPNDWHQVAVTWRAAEVRLYVDGEMQREVVDANMILPGVDKNSVFMVGDSYNAGYGIQGDLSGVADTDIDELRLYTRALDASEISELAGITASITAPPPPHIIVPKTAHPPVIDGIFSFDEWRDAAGFTGFITLANEHDPSNGRLAQRQSAMLLTYDNDNLYIATFAPLPGGASLKSSVDRRDGPTYGDDSIEVYLDPTNTRRDGQMYQFVGNPGGYFLDLKNGDSTWNGDWQYKSAMQSNWRGFGQTYWVTEIAAPFKMLGRTTPANGEKWAANFARTWQTGVQLYTSWAWTGTPSYGVIQRFGELEFQDHAPAFQWTVLRDLNLGRPTLEGTVLSSAAVNLEIRAAGEKLIDAEITDDMQSPKPWLYPIDLSSASQSTLEVQAKSGEKVLYSAQMPYRIETQAIRVLLSPVPSRELLIVDADPVRYRKEWQNGGKMELKLVDATGKIFGTAQIVSTAVLPALTEFSLRDVPAGNYQVEVAVLDNAGKVVATQSEKFVKPKPAIWVDNKIGITDRVPKPWMPIIVTSQNLRVWGREYQFGDNALPQQVSAAGQNLLQSPARLIIDGSTLPVGGAKIIEQSGARVVRTGNSQSGAWQINWKCTAEYDGMLWYEIMLAPRADQVAGASLQSLALELPLRSETSNLYHAANGPYAFGGGESGGTPASWSGSWKQVFWLGNEEAGLCWFAESDEHWKLQQPRDAIHFTRDNNGAVARVQFVNESFAVSKPITYRFGLQATPTRPMPMGWRAWRQSSGGSFIPNDPIHPTHAISSWMNWSPFISSPFDVKPDAAKLVDEYHAADTKVIPYQGLLALNEKAPDFDYYQAEWLTQPKMDAGGEAGQQTWWVNVKGSFQDYFLYAMREMVRNQKWDGMYFDFAQGAIPDVNEFHGSGYIDEKGVRRPTYDILAQREFFKRLWIMLQDEIHVDEPVVMIHNSQCILPPVDSFANIYYDGEQFLFSPKVYDDYTKVLSRDSFRAEFLTTHFGGVPLFLPETGVLNQERLNAKTETEKASALQHLHSAMDSLLLFTLTHGTNLSPEQMDQDYLNPLRAARTDFDIGVARFSGYWENEALVAMVGGNPDVKVSLYIHDDRLWLETGNWNDAEQTVTVKLDLKKISPSLNVAKVATKNIWKDGLVTRNGDSCSFTVPPKAARIIEIYNP